MIIKREKSIVEGSGKYFFAKYEKNGIDIVKYWDMEEFEKVKPAKRKIEDILIRHKDYFLFLIVHKHTGGFAYPSFGEYKYGIAGPTQYFIINMDQPYIGALKTIPMGRKFTRILIHKDFIKTVLSEINIKYPEHDIEFKIGPRLKTAVFKNIFGILSHGFRNDYPESILFVETALHQFIMHVLKTHPGTHAPIDKKMIECLPDDYRIRLVMDYIRSNFAKNITLDELSKISCLSKSHFLYLFKQKTGCSPYKYLSDYRIKKAMELLKDKDLRIGDISQSIGYSSERQFYYFMNKRLRKTPKQLRKELLR